VILPYHGIVANINGMLFIPVPDQDHVPVNIYGLASSSVPISTSMHACLASSLPLDIIPDLEMEPTAPTLSNHKTKMSKTAKTLKNTINKNR
jgi:hypothetical protein